MTTVADFFDYWRAAKLRREELGFADSTHPDDAEKLHDEHLAASKVLEDTKAEVLKFLRPVKTRGGFWSLGFDPDKVDEVATLGNLIEDTDCKLQSIAQTVAQFLELSSGACRIEEIATRRATIRQRLKAAENFAKAAVNTELRRAGGDIFLDKIKGAPDVAEAYAALDRLHKELDSQLEDLDRRLAALRQLVG